MPAREYPALLELLKGRQLKALKEQLEELNVVDVAGFIEGLAGEDIVISCAA